MAGAVQRAQQGDPDAFRCLYRDLQPRLLRYLHALAGEDAEDIAAETWLHITRDLPSFTGSYDGFRGWVATIARHRALDHLRHRARRPPAGPGPRPGPDRYPRPRRHRPRRPGQPGHQRRHRPDRHLAPRSGRSRPAPRRPRPGRPGRRQVLGKRAGAVRTAAYRGLRTLARNLKKADPPAGVTRARDLALKDMR